VPFLVGIAILPVGLYIAVRLQETLDVSKAHATMGGVLVDVLASHKVTLLFCMFLVSGATITQYFFNYTTTYGITVLHLPASVSLSVSLVFGIVGTIAAVLGGVAGDRYDRWMVMIWPRFVLIVAILPVMMLLNAYPNPTVFLTLVAALAAVHSFSSAVLIILIPTCFPAKIRTTGLGIAYSVGVMIFGGTAQVIFTWLISATGSPLSPAYYLIATNLLTIIGAWSLRSRERLHRDA
jgi:predicted MFS family arabinose efflux permease